MDHETSLPGIQPKPAPSNGGDREGGVLPVPPTPFLGREDDVTRVLCLLDDPAVRLLTLTGPGGVGKTRLAIEAARRIESDYAEGARFIPLAAVRDPGLIPSSVAEAIVGHQRVNRMVSGSLKAQLRDRHLLMVLDNFEHLLSADPLWLSDLLTHCPRLKVMVTSRVALNIGGEQLYPVSPLGIPTIDAAPDLGETTALKLFAQRARAVRPDFTLDASTVYTVAEICRRLDGLPLAIELAAAWSSILSPDEILARLSHRFTLLEGGHRDAPPRLRSLRDAIDWSYHLLPEAERMLFRRLSVFVGGFTMEAAEAVCAWDETSPGDVLSGLSTLMSHSLVERTTHRGAASRFHMLETIREFAADRLAESGEEAEVRDRHAHWVLELAQSTRSGQNPLHQALAMDRLVPEYPNIRAALHWWAESDEDEALSDLVDALVFMWIYNRPPSEGLTWYERALRSPCATPEKRLGLLIGAAEAAHMLSSPLVDAYIEELTSMTTTSACSLIQRAVAISVLAIRNEDLGEYEQAEAQFLEARRLSEQAGDPWRAIQCDYHLGVVAYGMGKLEKAVTLLARTRDAAISIGDRFVPDWCLVYLAFIACERGETDQAITFLREHPALCRKGTDQENSLDHHNDPFARAAAGVVASALGKYRLAARLLGSAEIEMRLRYPEKIIVERFRGFAHDALGDGEFKQLSNIGYRMRQDEVLKDYAYLLSGTDDQTAQNPPIMRSPHKLSPRELEVVQLLAQGLTNQEIADALYVSRRTITSHLDHILTKLDVRSRTAAVAFAIRSGLA